MTIISRLIPSAVLLAVIAPALHADEPQKPRTPATESSLASWTFGDYVYDGSGNIESIGVEVRNSAGTVVSTASDVYAYDAANRLTRATAAGGTRVQQYAYDSFGNLTSIETQSPGQILTITPGVDPATNRMSRTDGFNAWSRYDAAGNDVAYLGAARNTYDMLGAMTSYRGQELYFYTAGDERIARTDMSAVTWTITLRDESGKPLREVSWSVDTHQWQWKRDYVYAGSTLLASVATDPAGSGGETTRHYHRDHLGTPRLLTDAAGVRVSQDELYPFGVDVAFNVNDPERLHFTGHERDYHGGTATANTDYLDYMHARYYRAAVGRFLAVDPGQDWDLEQPQSWNMYSYVRNDPMNTTDPTGKYSYLVSRPTAFGKAHLFIVTHARYPGDPKANVRSYGNTGIDGGRVGRVDATTRGMSQGTEATDQRLWTSAITNKDVAYALIPASDDTVLRVADSVQPSTAYFVAGPNSNSAATAVANTAAGQEVAVPGDRNAPGATPEHRAGIKFSNGVQNHDKDISPEEFKKRLAEQNTGMIK